MMTDLYTNIHMYVCVCVCVCVGTVASRKILMMKPFDDACSHVWPTVIFIQMQI